jgi:hypothetical protein
MQHAPRGGSERTARRSGMRVCGFLMDRKIEKIEGTRAKRHGRMHILTSMRTSGAYLF